jgi:uncharacterized membrane protein
VLAPANKEQDRLGLERLLFFSDAVFAIAITLLALEIRLPVTSGPLTDAQLLQGLWTIWPKYLGYIVSFLVIGVFWMGHHRRFQFIECYDRTLILLNIFLLMVVAFVPFPTSIISQYGNQTATIFYALTITAMGLLSVAIWQYASHHNRLVSPQITQQQRRRETLRTLVVPSIFALSVGISFINADLAKISWVLIAFVLRLL